MIIAIFTLWLLLDIIKNILIILPLLLIALYFEGRANYFVEKLNVRHCNKRHTYMLKWVAWEEEEKKQREQDKLKYPLFFWKEVEEEKKRKSVHVGLDDSYWTSIGNIGIGYNAGQNIFPW